MKVCETKHWSTDDWQALSEDAQNSEIAWYEYRQEQKLAYLQQLEDALPRDKKSNKINVPESYYLILLARMEVL